MKYQPRHNSQAPHYQDLIPQLERYSPLVVVDVGAVGGLENPWKNVAQYIYVIGFEPEDSQFRELTNHPRGSSTYLNTGLYNQKTTVDFYVTKGKTNSLILPPNESFLAQFNPKHFVVDEVVKLNVDTLDNQLSEHGFTDVDFIKIDTQGTELPILEGARDILQRSIFGLEVEVEFSELYQKQALFGDVDKFLRDNGFQLFFLNPRYWKRVAGRKIDCQGQLLYADAVYLREEQSFLRMINSLNKTELQKAKLIKALFICLLYRHDDYAIYLFNGHRDKFNDSEQQIISSILENPSRSGLSSLKKRLHRLKNLFNS